MLSVEDHLAAVADLLDPTVRKVLHSPPEVVSLGDQGLLGRVCAAAVTTPFPLPPFDNSQMDGYAVCARDLLGATPSSPIALPLGVATAAGDAPGNHVAASASPIMTGAPLPFGADSVVPVEATVPPQFPPLHRSGEPPREATIRFVSECSVGAFVRRRGEDQHAGETIVDQSQRITPSRIGALAAAGITHIPVLRRIQILVCTSGDELACPRSGALRPGKIHDSNGPMLEALLRSAGAAVRVIRTGDTPQSLLDALTGSSDDIDLIVTSGGISAGAFEVVRDALGPLGITFVSIAMQPGGPQGLGTLTLPNRQAGIPVLCFPGNPVSSLLSAQLFLLPTLREIAGLPAQPNGEWRPLAVDTPSPKDKLQLRRSVLLDDGRVLPLPPGSHLLHDFARADLIAEIPRGVSVGAANSSVYTWRVNGE